MGAKVSRPASEAVRRLPTAPQAAPHAATPHTAAPHAGGPQAAAAPPLAAFQSASDSAPSAPHAAQAAAQAAPLAAGSNADEAASHGDAAAVAGSEPSVHDRNEGLLDKLASLRSSVELTVKTPSGDQLARDMQSFAARRKEGSRAILPGQQVAGTLTAEQVRELFPPDGDDAPAVPSRAELAAKFKLAPASLDLLLKHYSGVTIWSDDRGQLHGRASRPR